MASLSPDVTKLIESEVRKQVWKLLTGAILAIGVGTALSVVMWVPSQAAKLALDDPALKTVRDDILRDAGALQGETKRLRSIVDAASNDLDELSEKIAELQEADASAVATRVAALNELGDSAKDVLAAIERVRTELRAEIPKGVRVVSFGPSEHMGWGNRNAHQHFCPNRAANQVMVSGAVGNNGDFSVACGSVELVR